MSTTMVLIVYLLYQLAEKYNLSEEVFFAIVGIVANVYNNLANTDKKELQLKLDSHQKTIWLLETGVNPDKTENVYTNSSLPTPPKE
jgi:hypothetical protein